MRYSYRLENADETPKSTETPFEQIAGLTLYRNRAIGHATTYYSPKQNTNFSGHRECHCQVVSSQAIGREATRQTWVSGDHSPSPTTDPRFSITSWESQTPHPTTKTDD